MSLTTCWQSHALSEKSWTPNMAPNNNSNMLEYHQGVWSSKSPQLKDVDLETLEADVKQMAEKLLEYRATLEDKLKDTIISALVAQRPLFPQSSSAPNSGASEENISRGESLSAPEDPETAKKVKLLKEKISSNCSAMPIVLKNMEDCIAKIDKLDSYNAIIYPAFKRKKGLDKHDVSCFS